MVSQFSFLRDTAKYTSGQMTKVYVSEPLEPGEEAPEEGTVPLYSAKTANIEEATEGYTDQKYDNRNIEFWASNLILKGAISGAQIAGDPGHLLMNEAYQTGKRIVVTVEDPFNRGKQTVVCVVTGINKSKSVNSFNQITYSFAFKDLPIRFEVPPPTGGGGEIEIDNETYVITLLDSSGSMAFVLEPLTAAISELRVLLGDLVYGSDELANKYVKPVLSLTDEKWVEWMAQDYRDNENEPEKYLFLIFANESDNNNGITPAQADYHKVPRQVGLEPTSMFLSHHAQVELVISEYEIFNAIVFVPTSSPSTSEEIAFTGHLLDSINAINGYPGFSGNIVPVANWPIDATGSQIFDKIAEFLLD